jgi:preprotein translocase subunit SecF
MKFLTKVTAIDFLTRRYLLYAVSAVLIALSIVSLATRGLNFT